MTTLGFTFVPTIATTGGSPNVSVGNPGFGIQVQAAPPGAPVLFAIGASATSWNGQNLPIDLGPFGLSGCFLRVAPNLLAPSVTGLSGTPTVGLSDLATPIPANINLVGLDAFVQALILNPTPGTQVGQMTPALRITLQ